MSKRSEKRPHERQVERTPDGAPQLDTDQQPAGGPAESGQRELEGGGAAAGIDFEQAMQELEALVRRLEDGSLPLDESIKSFERGMELVRLCAGELGRAERRVKQLMEEAARLRLVDFEAEQE